MLEFFHIIEKLKTTPRTGWTRLDLKSDRAESIADHMFRMAILALCSERTDLNISRCVELAIVHDLAEAIAGDLVVGQGTTTAEKAALEEVRASVPASSPPQAAMERMLTEMLPAGSAASQRIRALWREYEDRQTAESKFVKDRACASRLRLTSSVDRFELGLQAVEYESRGVDGLHPFLASTQPKIESDEVKRWSADLMHERQRDWEASRTEPYRPHDETKPYRPHDE